MDRKGGIMNPGSPKAKENGCTCPVKDNQGGMGAYMRQDGQPVFWYNPKCPIHGKSEDIDGGTVLWPMREGAK